MRTSGITGVLSCLLLSALSGTSNAGERQRSHSPHHQTRGMIERLHNRDGDRNLRQSHEGRRGEPRHHARDRRHEHGRDEGQHRREGDRHLYYGHERWRDGTERHRHSSHGRGYWHDYHHHTHRHHGYRHRFYNNYHYYYNGAGFYFPGFGLIAHGHAHGRHCPSWHFDDFAAGFILGAIIID